LENGPNADNTIVVLWSDHGWHLGEKQHWQKFTIWRAATRVPLMIRVPKGASGALPSGTPEGTVCNQPVNLLSLFRTLSDVAGLPDAGRRDAPSLLPLLKDANGDWDHVSSTFLHDVGSVSISDKDWRYIHYANGEGELYHISEDPYEWNNLASDPKYGGMLEALRRRVPKQFAPKAEPSIAAMAALKWVPANKAEAPASKPDGSTFEVIFINRQKTPVELFWMDRQGKPKSYGEISAGGQKRMQTRPGAVWRINAMPGGEVLGHFSVGDRSAKAVVPR